MGFCLYVFGHINLLSPQLVFTFRDWLGALALKEKELCQENHLNLVSIQAAQSSPRIYTAMSIKESWIGITTNIPDIPTITKGMEESGER